MGETTVMDSLARDITERLKAMGYRVSGRLVREVDILTGNIKDFELIHAVSSNERLVLTIRLAANGWNRLHLTASSNNISESELNRLEEAGFKVHVDKAGISATLTAGSDELIRKLSIIAEIVG